MMAFKTHAASLPYVWDLHGKRIIKSSTHRSSACEQMEADLWELSYNVVASLYDSEDDEVGAPNFPIQRPAHLASTAQGGRLMQWAGSAPRFQVSFTHRKEIVFDPPDLTLSIAPASSSQASSDLVDVDRKLDINQAPKSRGSSDEFTNARVSPFKTQQQRSQAESATTSSSSTVGKRPVPAGPAAMVDASKQSFKEIVHRIYRLNDQRASLYLQDRLKAAVPGEYEELVQVIRQHAGQLMTHRFGNFLVQCMLGLATQDEVLGFGECLQSKIALLSTDQFCCHVIQKLLDVAPLVVQARVAAELLDQIVYTMTNVSGSHVWQKLLHLPWPSELPSMTELVRNAIELSRKSGISEGWISVAANEAGCATIKSFLGVSSAGSERQECVDELLASLDRLIMWPHATPLVMRLASISTSRSRTTSHILSHARKYSLDPTSSQVLISLLQNKIPGFGARLANVLAPYQDDLAENQNGKRVLQTLDLIQHRK